jgi:hypothetical protein
VAAEEVVTVKQSLADLEAAAMAAASAAAETAQHMVAGLTQPDMETEVAVRLQILAPTREVLGVEAL